ncbi:MAG: methyltransferase domain-containing protein, partial [Bacteroidales bacterium]|nr:methyltransferase domain-containing protein [Bacteroidales bacterium]
MGTYEFDGDQYKKASKHQKEWGNTIISRLKLTGAETVLDLGCGDGVLTKQLSELVPNGKVLGIVGSEGMIKAAKTLFSNNLTFEKMDINDMGFENEFDFIFSNATFHWIKDHKKLINNCHTALKKNGFIRFNFAGNGNCSNFFAVINDVIKHEKYKKYFIAFEWPWYMPSVEEYREKILECNFSNIEIWEENADRYFDNQEEMSKWIEQPSIVPFIKLVSD